ncbi:MAG: B-box zinc finger protein [Pyrinomonadaceae bacterium]
MSVKNEIWQVMIHGEVYEADMESLKQWVVEGRVLPTDHVRKGNLKWIQADRAPAMRSVFSGVEITQPPMPPAPGAWADEAPGYSTPPQSHSVVDEPGADVVSSEPLPQSGLPPATAGSACHQHPQALPAYVCRECGATLCRECPKFVGTTKIPLCPLCGDLCQPYQKLQERGVRQTYQRSGFGFEDFGRALGYPLKNIFTLISAALLYSVLLLAGFYGQMVAFMILFGCISLVINRVSAGKTDRNFMPDFSSFSWWDDLFMPGLLGVGITIVTAGPMIVLLVAVWFGVLSPASPLSFNPAQEAQAEQEQEQQQLTNEDMDELIDGTDAKKSEEAAKKIEQLHPAYQMNKEIEATKDSASSLTESLTPFLYASMTIIILFLLALAWAVFYYPMALTVAGYTEDFWSTVNPLIGLDTIRRMGFVYVKAFLMYLCIETVGFVMSVIIYMVTAPFDMPFVGNLPARFLDGMVTFYINLVLACILGLALFKCADKLDIPTD